MNIPEIFTSAYKSASERVIDILDLFKNLRKGYGFIPTYYYSDPKIAIAHKVLPVLRAYRKLLSRRENWSLSNWVIEEGEQLTEEQMRARWLSYVDQMILAFHLVHSGQFHDEKNEALIDEGLRLFSMYYRHLWD